MNKPLSILTILCFFIPILINGQTSNKEIELFRNEKFGLFIHWGLYSQAAGEWKGKPTKGGEHFMLYERIPLKEYALLANDFNPKDFNAKEWVETAKRSGMKYIVYTTKHHDGFAMYDSKCSDYNIVKKTPFGRDPLKELAEACRKEGIQLGLYYSLGRDWEDPDVPTNWPEKAGRSNTWDYPDEDGKVLSRYVARKVKPQLRELLTEYGNIATIWFDTPELITKDQSRELKELINTLQPNCLINNRIGNGLGDYSIVEQKLMDKIENRPWEACLTMGRNWGYNKFDTIYKAPEEMIRHLVDIVSKGGNLLLNIGPTGKGNFPKQTKPGLEAYHKWLKSNGEAIYNTRPWIVFGEDLSDSPKEVLKTGFHDAEFDGTPKSRIPDIRFTSNGKTVYAIIRDIIDNNYTIKSIDKDKRIKNIKLLENNKSIKWSQTAEGLNIQFDRAGKTQFPIYVLKIEFE